MESNFKWQDAVGVVGIFLAIGGMADMPLFLRVTCFVLCAICMPISFFSHSWPVPVKGIASFMVIGLMGFMIFHALEAAIPKPPPIEPTISWFPAPMNAGESLTQKQLNAVATVDGVGIDGEYVYNPAIGAALPAGTVTLSVTFTPNNESLYRTQTKTTVLVVKPLEANEKPKELSDPIKVTRIDVLGVFQAGGVIGVQLNIQNVSGKTLLTRFVGASQFQPTVEDSFALGKAEDELWDKFSQHPLQSPVEISMSQDGLRNKKWEVGPLSESQAKLLSSGRLVIYFFARIQDERTNKNIVEMCGYVRQEKVFTGCERHNKP